jgi:hypothetical protein
MWHVESVLGIKGISFWVVVVVVKREIRAIEDNFYVTGVLCENEKLDTIWPSKHAAWPERP